LSPLDSTLMIGESEDDVSEDKNLNGWEAYSSNTRCPAAQRNLKRLYEKGDFEFNTRNIINRTSLIYQLVVAYRALDL
jgi:hypothetical protein